MKSACAGRAYLVGPAPLRSTFLGPRKGYLPLVLLPQTCQARCLHCPTAPAIQSSTAMMHHSDLYLPVPSIPTSRHATPARLPASAPNPVWPQSLAKPPPQATSKKRNVERACDDCRRRKTRCDGPKMPDNVCTNCVQNRKICTYVLAPTPSQMICFHTDPFCYPQRNFQASGTSQSVRCVLMIVLLQHAAYMPLTVMLLVWRTGWKRWKHC